MTYRFNPLEGHVLVIATLWGLLGRIELPLALDTGAVGSVPSWQTAVLLGYDPASIPHRSHVVSATGEAWVPRLSLARLTALGQECRDFPVLWHTLPASCGLDGVLGLDSLRGRKVTLDFREGLISLD